ADVELPYENLANCVDSTRVLAGFSPRSDTPECNSLAKPNAGSKSPRLHTRRLPSIHRHLPQSRRYITYKRWSESRHGDGLTPRRWAKRRTQRSFQVRGTIRSDLTRQRVVIHDHTKPRQHHFLRGHLAPNGVLIRCRIHRIIRGVVV